MTRNYIPDIMETLIDWARGKDVKLGEVKITHLWTGYSVLVYYIHRSDCCDSIHPLLNLRLTQATLDTKSPKRWRHSSGSELKQYIRSGFDYNLVGVR